MQELPSELIKKRIEFRLGGVALALDVSQSLFSSYQIDTGTRALLNSLRKNHGLCFERVLDLGCGYGVAGLFVKSQYPSASVELTDRDALAVAFARHNAALNGLDAAAYPSLDFQSISRQFSLILLNFPAKLERPGLELFLAGAAQQLERGGVLAVVVVRELARDLEEALAGKAIEVSFREEKKHYTLLHLAFHERFAPPPAAYERSRLTLRLTSSYEQVTARGLPEFDRLSDATQALIELLPQLPVPDEVLYLEPGQGHGPAAAADAFRLRRLTIASRDLLALEFTKANLVRDFPGVAVTQQIVPFLASPPPASPLLIWWVRDKDDIALNRHNLGQLSLRRAPLLVYGEEGILDPLFARSDFRCPADVRIGRSAARWVTP